MPTPVYLTINEFPGTGAAAPTVVDFNFAGGYISPAHVKAEIFNPVTYLRTPVPVTDDNFVTDYRLSLPVVVPTGSILRVYRDTPKDQPLVNFTNGARIAENNLDLVAQQAVFVAAESADQIEATQVADVLQAVEAAALSAATAQTGALAAAASATLSQTASQEGASIAGGFALAAASSAAASSASAAASAAEASAVRADLASTASGKGAEMVTFTQAGTNVAARTTRSKLREWVSSDDFPGADVGAQVNAALAEGHKRIRVLGTKTLSTQILLTALSKVTIDFREATVTAAAGLNMTMVRLINCTHCIIKVGELDGNAAGQTDSSFGVDLNGGSRNKVRNGRVTNCKTYGIYNIYCQYADISDIEVDNCQQAGIAADVGPGDCFGVRVRNVIVRDNGLGGIGATSGLYLEGTPGTNHWFKGLVIDNVLAYGNRGAGVAGQGWDGYTLRGIDSRDNHQQGIALFACLRGNGGDFQLHNNDVGGVPGYGNGLSIDDTGVTPASQYNTFANIVSSNHGGYAVLERGTANNNSFLDVQSTSDGALVALTGANSVSTQRGSRTGSLSVVGQLLGGSTSSGIGYGVGSGGAVAQATSKSTGVTLNAPSGQITMVNTAIAAGALAEFVLTNSAISSNDLLCFNVVSGATQAAYTINARPANGSATIEVRNNTAASLAEALVIRFVVIKAAQS